MKLRSPNSKLALSGSPRRWTAAIVGGLLLSGPVAFSEATAEPTADAAASIAENVATTDAPLAEGLLDATREPIDRAVRLVADAPTLVTDGGLEALQQPTGSVSAGFDAHLETAVAESPLGEGVGIAGKVVDRFAPPVASGAGAAAFDAKTDGRGALSVNTLRPCDTPGAACRNFGGPQAVTVPVNPPITPGIRGGGLTPPVAPGARVGAE